jgi:surfactin synthase thioesterase subunit
VATPRARRTSAHVRCGNAARRTDIQLESPTTLFWGDADHEVPKEDMLAWQDHVTRAVELVEFNGDHFFINHNRGEFLGHVRKIVEGSLGAMN